jgi:hypothetical protein
MTMPHLMNCDHSEDGWCLECVRKLWEQKNPITAGPAVEGWSYRLNGVFIGFDTDRAFWVSARKFAGKGEVVATTLTERQRTPEEDLMDRIGSHSGDNPLPSTTI